MRTSCVAASSADSASGSGRTSTSASPNGTNQPTYDAKVSPSSIARAPGMCAAANSARGRASMRWRPGPIAERAPAGSSCGHGRRRAQDRRSRSVDRGHLRVVRRVRAETREERRAEGRLVGRPRSSGLCQRSSPIVEVRSPSDGPAAQKLPRPWVGRTATSSGSLASACSDWNWARQRLGRVRPRAGPSGPRCRPAGCRRSAPPTAAVHRLARPPRRGAPACGRASPARSGAGHRPRARRRRRRRGGGTRSGRGPERRSRPDPRRAARCAPDR